jgi:hypothetical protein
MLCLCSGVVRSRVRGRERAVAEFSQEKVIAETLAVYREV